MNACKVFVLPSGLRFVAIVDERPPGRWSLVAPMVLPADGELAAPLRPLLPHAAEDVMELQDQHVLASYEPDPALAERHLQAALAHSPAVTRRLQGAPAQAAAPPRAVPAPVPAPRGTNRAEGDVDRLVFEQFFGGDRAYRGVFVDVGAARPDFLSVSALYRELGWRVLAVEPNPEFAELQRRAGSTVLEYACGAKDEDGVEFTLVNQHGQPYEGGAVSYESFSSLGIKPEYAALKPNLDKRTIRVKLRRLDTILRDHAPDVGRIDILSIDVEGWELEVLDGLDLVSHRPKVMVVENLFQAQAYVDRLAREGYGLWRRIYPNDVYVDRPLLPR